MITLNTGTELVTAARKEGNDVVASINGDIDLHNAPEVRSALLQLLQQNSPRNLVLNLSNVPYMDSSAIAVLVEALQKIRRAGGKVFLTNLQPRVQGLLEIARLGTIFSLVKEEKDAFTS